ncbi:MAG: hypothetical protein AAGB48_10480 [Planctomycetota bacterium]
MRFPADPIRRHRLGVTVTTLAGAAACAAVAAWAFAPVVQSRDTGLGPDVSRPIDRPEALRHAVETEISASTFEIDLWPAAKLAQAPEPEPPPQPTPRPRPPTFRLVGIGTDASAAPIRQAAFDDPRRGRLVIVRVGETIGAYTVVAIGDRSVSLLRDEQTYELALSGRDRGDRP